MAPSPFLFAGAPQRVIFGQGLADRLPAELQRIDVQRPLLVSTPGQADKAMHYVAGVQLAGVHAHAAMHTPVEISETALAVLRGLGADAIISFGGGSATGLGKALAARTALPLIAIGTTYGGSEMTALIGETKDGVKATRRDPRVMPRATIYDVDLTLGLPVSVSAASGLNAIAHAVEAIYSADANPIVTLIALDAIRLLAGALPIIVAQPTDLAARWAALQGACEAGLCLDAVSMGLHHKLCHTLGGAFGLPHAETHAVMLPYALAYNAPAIGEALAGIGRALGSDDAVAALHALARAVAPASSLRALGMPEDGIDRAADLAAANPYWNPRPIERAPLRDLIARAWAGDSPR